MTNIVVEIRGGVLVEVYCDDPNIRPVVINWDNAEPSHPSARTGFVWAFCPRLNQLPKDTRSEFELAAAEEPDERRIIVT